MNDKEIDEAIENNPGGSDLEIALAIGSDEVAVSRRRKVMVTLTEAAAKAKKEAEEAEEAEKLAAEKKKAGELKKQLESEKGKAKEAVKMAEAKNDPGHRCGPIPPRQKYFLQDPENGTVVELIRINEDNRNMVIFQLA